MIHLRWNVVRTLVVVMCATAPLAGQQFWERSEPYSTGLNQIMLGGGDTLYGSLNSGFTRSTNGGTTWTVPIIVSFVREFDIAPNGTIFVAQNQNAMSRSTNKGNSFTQSATGITEKSCSSVLALASGTVLAGSQTGIFRSTNNGTNWTLVAGVAQLAEDTNIVDLARFGTTIYAIATMPTNNPEWTVAYRSTDDGVTWTKGTNKLEGVTAYKVFINPSGHLFIRSNQGVRYSTNSGDSWSTFAFGTSYIDDIAFDSAGATYVVIDDNDSSNFVYRSSDNGLSWNPIAVPFASFTRLTVGRQGRLYLSQDQTYRSTDHGATWQGLPVSFPNVTIFKESPKFGLFVTAGGSAYQNLYRSTDVGKSWKPMVTGVTGIPIVAFHQDTMLVADNFYNAKLFRSTDNGATFKTVTGMSVISGYINALLGTSYHSVIAGTSTGIFRTYDGKIWSKVSSIPATFLDQRPNGTLYAFRSFSGSGVLRSTDSGSTWTELKNGMGNTIVHSLAFSPNGNLFAGSDAGLFRSTDAGDSWVRIDTQKVKPYGIYVAVNSDGTLFFGGAKSGPNTNAYRSSDNGASWTSIDNNITSIDNQATFRSLFVASNGTLFAGTSSGLFRSTGKTTSVIMNTTAAPERYDMVNNYPNPFNPATTVTFVVPSVPSDALNGGTVNVKLTIYNALGQQITQLFNGTARAGERYQIPFTARGLSSGIFFAHLTAGGKTFVHRMLLLQ